MKKWFFFTFLLSASFIVKAQQQDIEMNKFIDDLMKKMTIDEKIGQLNLPGAGDITTGQAANSNIAQKIKSGQVGGLFNIKGLAKIKAVQKIAVEQSRLKIPLLFGMDVIHGYQTEFPTPIALSSTWNPSLIEQTARVAAVEASADGICWTFSPMVDIARDPRWGRIAEGSGEDAYLGSVIAKAMVKGYQGTNLAAPNTIMACVKHFALYGAAEAGRDYNTTDMSRLRMYNEYFPPYKAAVDAGVGSVMASFNEIDGMPATANKWLQTNVLRDQWKFNGFVVTDYTAINELTEHGIGDTAHVTALSLKAGIDMDMVSEGFLLHLKKLLKEKKVTENDINLACKRILVAKYKLGLFKNPYLYTDEKRLETDIFTVEHRKLAREAAAKSFVLLKNNNQLLPIAKNKSIAIIGPLGNNKPNMVGTWAVATDVTKAVSLMEGIQAAVGNKIPVYYAKGSRVDGDAVFESRVNVFGKEMEPETRSNEELLNEALATAAKADIIIAAVGEVAEMSGESSSRSSIQMPEVQRNLLKALLQTGKPVITVLFTGRPLAIKWEKENLPAILNVWHPGTEAGHAIADVLFGDVNPSGKLTATWPQNEGQIPIFYSHKNTGRPLGEGKWFEKFKSNYLDVTNEPLFPFGYGLSYTEFKYGPLQLSATKMNKNGKITASVTVTNVGNTDGLETVQWYIRDLVGSITRPVKELKYFEQVFLKKGETKTVQFTISLEDLKFYNANLKWVAEPGDFKVMVGTNSSSLQNAQFELLP
ncbi:MAG: beta-glucosidase BglX [Chitinophagaceae bacterium]